jgi:hypothetical protein
MVMFQRHRPVKSAHHDGPASGLTEPPATLKIDRLCFDKSSRSARGQRGRRSICRTFVTEPDFDDVPAEVALRRARLAPEMISMPGNGVLRRRQRGALPVWLPFGQARPLRACCSALSGGSGARPRSVLTAAGDNFGLLLRWQRLLCTLLPALRRQSKSPKNSQSLVFHGRLNRLAVGFQARHAMCGFANARTGQLCQSGACLGGGSVDILSSAVPGGKTLMTTDAAAIPGAAGGSREARGGGRGSEARAISVVSVAHFVQHFQSLVLPPLFPFRAR